jgi:hypothetical protein
VAPAADPVTAAPGAVTAPVELPALVEDRPLPLHAASTPPRKSAVQTPAMSFCNLLHSNPP